MKNIKYTENNNTTYKHTYGTYVICYKFTVFYSQENVTITHFSLLKNVVVIREQQMMSHTICP